MFHISSYFIFNNKLYPHSKQRMGLDERTGSRVPWTSLCPTATIRVEKSFGEVRLDGGSSSGRSEFGEPVKGLWHEGIFSLLLSTKI